VNGYRIADGCCCAGLGADGYASVFGASAIIGFDIDDQPHYPYRFVKADVMALLEWDTYYGIVNGYDALHMSFPCQAHTTAGRLRDAQGGKSRFPDLLTPGLDLLRKHWSHKPWIVENVDDNRGEVRKIMAPREGEHLIMLCGSMFGLEVQRHRLFLANFPLRQPAATGKGAYAAQGCRHDTFPVDPDSGKPRPWGVYHVKGDAVPDGGRTARDEEHGRHVMGSRRLLPWDSLKEGFPPAYTAWVGADLLVELRRREAASTCQPPTATTGAPAAATSPPTGTTAANDAAVRRER
jgi:DNA (cytosine-5)-methyltransferase 1